MGRSAAPDSTQLTRPVHWLFFDFVGTLAFNDPPRAWHYLRVCARHGIFLERRAVWAALRDAWGEVDHPDGMEHLEASRDRETYEAFRVQMERSILDRLGVASEQLQIVREVLDAQDRPDAYSLYPDTLPALAALHGQGYHISIVSNFSWDLDTLAAALGLSPFCDAIVTSARAGYRKPHPRIFEIALKQSGADASRVLFVGDSMEADVLGPASYGFQSLLLDRQQSGRHPVPSIGSLTDLVPLLGSD